MARCLFVVPVLLVVSGCDFLFQIDEVHARADAAQGRVELDASAPTHDAEGGCTVEEFGSLGTQWTPFSDPPAASVAVNGTVSITLHGAVNDHGGIDTAVRDFTGYSIEVDVVSVPDTASETYMDWARGDDWYSIAVDHGQLSYGFSLNSSYNTSEIPYVPSAHRGFKMAHEPAANLIRMSVRSVDGVWSELGTMPVAIPMTSLHVELAAGSYTMASTTGVAQFDHFVACH